MKKIISLVIILVFITKNLLAQLTIEQINHRLDTRPYFNLGFDYSISVTIPDSVQEKFANALNRIIPESVLDSMLSLTSQQVEQIKRNVSRECRGDSTCIEIQYKKYIEDYRERHKTMYNRGIMPTRMILAAGNWQIKKAIPILKNAIGDDKYDQPSVFMALAKLGDDSIKQVLLERYSLSYILRTTPMDTIDNNVHISLDILEEIWTIDEVVKIAMYLKDKEILLYMLDLMYIKGISQLCIGHHCEDVPYISLFLFDLGFNDLRWFPNFNKLREITFDYRYDIRQLYDKQRNRREQRELNYLLSTEYRTMIKNQLRDWIIENVNFE
jgi:hypothetical protein